MEYKETKQFVEVEQLICREFYEYYRENRTHQALAIDQYNYFVKAMGGILRSLRVTAETSEAGIYLEGIGYFCFVRTKKLKTSINQKNPLRNKKPVRVFKLLLIPEEKNRNWALSDLRIVKILKTEYSLKPEIVEMFKEMNKMGERIFKEAKRNKYITEQW